MRRTVLIWALIGLGYAGFLLWHVPWKPALSPQEWRSLVAAAGGNGDVDIPQEMAAFFDADDGRPFYMLNVLDAAETAQYPPGQFPQITDAEAAARRYAAGVVPVLLARGGYPMFIGAPAATFIATVGAETGRFEQMALVRYRSRRDLLDLALSSDFQTILVHKWASLDGTLVMPVRKGLALDLSALVPALLLALGFGLTRRRRR